MGERKEEVRGQVWDERLLAASSLRGGAGTRSAAGSTSGPEPIQAAANIKSVSEASVAALQPRGSADPPDRTTKQTENNTHTLL